MKSAINESEIPVGTKVIVKVGRNEIEVEVTGIKPNGWLVRKPGSDREFPVSKIQRIVSMPEEDDTPNPAPESDAQPEKRKTILDVGLEVLRSSPIPLNTRDILAVAIVKGIWYPNGAKTPHQSLYSSFFRELQSANPRIRKSTTRKGAFEIIRD